MKDMIKNLKAGKRKTIKSQIQNKMSKEKLCCKNKRRRRRKNNKTRSI